MADDTFTFDDSGVDFEERASKQLAVARSLGKIDDPFAAIDARLDEALQAATTIEAKQIAGRQIRETIDDVKADWDADEKRLADVVASLHEAARNQGVMLSNLETMHPRAKQIIEDAEAEVKAAEAAIEAARTKITEAQGPIMSATSELAVAEAKPKILSLFNGRTAAVETAQRALQNAQAAKERAEKALSDAQSRLATAKQSFEEAPAKAERMHREMLENATAEESNQHIRAMHETANDMIRERIETADTAIKRRGQVIAASRQKLGEAVKQSEDGRTALAAQQQVVDDLQAKVDSGEYEQNSVEFKQISDQLSDARNKFGQIKAEVDAATGEAQEIEEKLMTLEMQRDALITLRGNYERSLRIGEAAAKLNAEVAAARVELAKGMSDLQIQSQLNTVSRDETVHAAQTAADAINAIERARIEYGKQHPEVRRAQLRIARSLTNAQDYIAEEDAALLKQWREGITLEDGEGAAPAAAPAPERKETKEDTGEFSF